MTNLSSDLPVISVIMPTYNQAAYLRESVDSILNQSFRNFEFIIIDDGSTDDTAKILSEYEQIDNRIVLVSQKNIGLTKSLNKALRMARGRFIARQDADDFSESNRLELMIKKIEDCSLVLGLYKRIYEGKMDAPMVSILLKYLPDFVKMFILNRVNLLMHGTFFFRKNDILKLGGYREKFKYSQDYDLFLRVSEEYEVSFVNDFVYRYRAHSDSVGHKNQESQFLFAVLASIFAHERRKTGFDSYEALEEGHLKDFTRSLVQYYKQFSVIAILTGFVRIGNFRNRKKIIETLF